MIFKIVITSLAEEMIQEIEDRRVRQQILTKIDALKTDPEKRGKPMGDEFTGYRTMRASGQRYRIIYDVDFAKGIVTVTGSGIRKEGDKGDIYERLRKLARLGLFKLKS